MLIQLGFKPKEQSKHKKESKIMKDYQKRFKSNTFLTRLFVSMWLIKQRITSLKD